MGRNMDNVMPQNNNIAKLLDNSRYITYNKYKKGESNQVQGDSDDGRDREDLSGASLSPGVKGRRQGCLQLCPVALPGMSA